MFHFSRGIPPAEAIPSARIAEVARQVIDSQHDRVFQYAPIGRYAGDPQLRAELAAYHGTGPERVFVTNGSLQALDLVAARLIEPGAVVYAEAPTYDRAVQIFERHGAKVVGVPLRSDGLDVTALAERLAGQPARLLYTIPDFQNPAGVTMTQEKRQEVVRLAHRHGFTIVEDIPYRDLRVRGVAPSSLAELDPDGRVVTVGSLSKVLSPGLRIGYVLADPEVVTELAVLAESTYLSPTPLSQAVAARCLADGLVTANVDTVRRLLAPRLDAAVAAVRSHLGEVLVAVPDGGYYVSLHLPVPSGENTFLDAARAAGVALTRGSGFYPGGSAPAPGTAFVRLPFQAMTTTEFAAGIERLAGVLRPTDPASTTVDHGRKDEV